MVEGETQFYLLTSMWMWWHEHVTTVILKEVSPMGFELGPQWWCCLGRLWDLQEEVSLGVA